ncbi:MAG: hypothetical protein E7167_05985 [Firmicutes bacterium]|nr:hypothetical protein [Bacillota bacterium]
MKYKWDKQRLKQLQQDPVAYDNLEELYTTLRDPFRLSQRERFSLKLTFCEDYTFLNEMDYIYPYIKTALDLPKLSQNIIHPKLKMTQDDIMTLTHDFYQKQTPKEIYSIFNMFFKDRFTHFKFIFSFLSPFYSAHTYMNQNPPEAFIEVCQSHTLEAPLNCIHEYGHCIDYFSYNPYKPDYYFPYAEVTSIFFELIALDYWETHTDLSNAARAERQIFYNSFINDNYLLACKYALIKDAYKILNGLKDEDYKIALKKLHKRLKITKQAFKDTLRYPADTILPYSLSTFIALELYHIYQTDPEKAFDLFWQFTTIDSENLLDLTQKILNIGITPTENINVLLKKLTK